MKSEKPQDKKRKRCLHFPFWLYDESAGFCIHLSLSFGKIQVKCRRKKRCAPRSHRLRRREQKVRELPAGQPMYLFGALKSISIIDASPVLI